MLLLGNRANGQHGRNRARKHSKEGEEDEDGDDEDEEDEEVSFITFFFMKRSTYSCVSARACFLSMCLLTCAPASACVHQAGGASAITVESLLALSRVKSVSDRTTTLLQCLVEALAKAQPDLLVTTMMLVAMHMTWCFL